MPIDFAGVRLGVFFMAAAPALANRFGRLLAAWLGALLTALFTLVVAIRYYAGARG